LDSFIWSIPPRHDDAARTRGWRWYPPEHLPGRLSRYTTSSFLQATKTCPREEWWQKVRPAHPAAARSREAGPRLKLDRAFGVIEVDPTEHLYTVLIDGSIAAELERRRCRPGVDGVSVRQSRRHTGSP